MLEIWPAILVAGVSFAIPEVLISNLHGPWLANIGSSVISMACLVASCSSGIPRRVYTFEGEKPKPSTAPRTAYSRADVTRAWVPWVILSVIVFMWGTQTGKKIMNTPEKVFASMSTWQTPPSKITNPQFVVGGLNNLALRVPPVVTKPTKEPAVFGLNWVSATGSGILLAALISGLIMGLSVPTIFKIYGQTLMKVRFSLMTIAAMMAIGFMTRYSGLDATMGLAFARTGHLYPFFGTLLGWLGVALTGSDTSSNVLFGSLQKITAQQVNASPILMARPTAPAA
jgi:lactate permease